MIPAKIEDVFIQLKTDLSGVIIDIIAGKFVIKEFTKNQTIFEACPFLEGTLEAITIKEPFLLEGMIIESDTSEFNIDIELFKDNNLVNVLIHNRTNVYKYVDQLNQNRNDIFFIKREIAEKNKELARLRKVADKANEEKSRFLAMMSHEIRNPLNSILGYTEMISSEKLTKTVSQYLKNLTAAGRNLKVIVDDILDLSRIESGKLELASEKFSLKEVINNCKNDFLHLNKKEEVSLGFKVLENVPQFVLGDSVRIHQILANLISNAIKFTKKGFVNTEVNLISETDKTINVVIKVSDSGRGMSEEQCLKIFEEYQQNKLSDNRIHGGAGLGLAIVNRLVKAMNGRVYVESKLNIGSTFYVEITLKKLQENITELVEENETKTAIDLTGKKILVADDDVLNQTIVSHILSKENVHLTIVNDGLEALSKLEEAIYDVVLLDINMPNMTGEELMKQKDSIAKYNLQTPILALTANTSTEDIDRYLKLGFSGVVSKPFTITSFIQKIKKAIN